MDPVKLLGSGMANTEATRRRFSPSWALPISTTSSRDFDLARPMFDLTQKTLHGVGGVRNQPSRPFNSHDLAPILVIPDETTLQSEADSSDFATDAVLSQQSPEDESGIRCLLLPKVSVWLNRTTRSMTRRCWQSSELWRTGTIFWRVLTMRLKSGWTTRIRVLHVSKETQPMPGSVSSTCPGLISPCSQLEFYGQVNALSCRADHGTRAGDKNVMLLLPGVLRNTCNLSPLWTVIGRRGATTSSRIFTSNVKAKGGAVTKSAMELRRSKGNSVQASDSEHDGLFSGTKIYVPNDQSYGPASIQHHDTRVAGHLGRWKTLELVSRTTGGQDVPLHWPICEHVTPSPD